MPAGPPLTAARARRGGPPHLTLTPYPQTQTQTQTPNQAGFDPISRKPLQRIEHAVPNLALKEAISEFLAEHPWAYQCTL